MASHGEFSIQYNQTKDEIRQETFTQLFPVNVLWTNGKKLSFLHSEFSNEHMLTIKSKNSSLLTVKIYRLDMTIIHKMPNDEWHEKDIEDILTSLKQLICPKKIFFNGKLFEKKMSPLKEITKDEFKNIGNELKGRHLSSKMHRIFFPKKIFLENDKNFIFIDGLKVQAWAGNFDAPSACSEQNINRIFYNGKLPLQQMIYHIQIPSNNEKKPLLYFWITFDGLLSGIEDINQQPGFSGLKILEILGMFEEVLQPKKSILLDAATKTISNEENFAVIYLRLTHIIRYGQSWYERYGNYAPMTFTKWPHGRNPNLLMDQDAKDYDEAVKFLHELKLDEMQKYLTTEQKEKLINLNKSSLTLQDLTETIFQNNRHDDQHIKNINDWNYLFNLLELDAESDKKDKSNVTIHINSQGRIVPTEEKEENLLIRHVRTIVYHRFFERNPIQLLLENKLIPQPKPVFVQKKPSLQCYAEQVATERVIIEKIKSLLQERNFPVLLEESEKFCRLRDNFNKQNLILMSDEVNTIEAGQFYVLLTLQHDCMYYEAMKEYAIFLKDKAKHSEYLTECKNSYFKLGNETVKYLKDNPQLSFNKKLTYGSFALQFFQRGNSSQLGHTSYTKEKENGKSQSHYSCQPNNC